MFMHIPQSCTLMISVYSSIWCITNKKMVGVLVRKSTKVYIYVNVL